jgi:hypothetical protein
MAVMVGTQVKLDNGQTITPQQGAWYDARQFWGGTLSEPGQINAQSNQQGAGQDVSEEVNRQTSVAAGLTPNANQDYINSLKGISTGMGTAGGETGTAGATATTTGSAEINLIDQQQKLFDESGITDLNKQIADTQASIDTKKAEADKRRKETNENPFLSEASRVGAIRKIDEALNDSLMTDEAKITNLQNQVTTKTNAINEKLNLQIKQYDIDRLARKDNFDMINSLLSAGALQYATPQDLANLAANAGIPVSFLKGMITQGSSEDLMISTETSAGGVVTVLGIDKKTGKIVSQKTAGAIGKPSSSGDGTESLTASQKREVVVKAREALAGVDTNGDMYISADEYIEAVKEVMMKTGLDEATADNFVAAEMTAYKRWNW